MNITSVNGGSPIKPGDTITIVGTGFGTVKGRVNLTFTAEGSPQERSFFDDELSLLTWADTSISFVSKNVRNWALPYTGDGTIFPSIAVVVIREVDGTEVERASLAAVINPPSGYAVLDLESAGPYASDYVLSHHPQAGQYGAGARQVVYETSTDEGSPVSLDADGLITIQTPNDVEQFEFTFQPGFFFGAIYWAPATQKPRSIPHVLVYELAPNPIQQYVSQNTQLFGLLRGQVVNKLEVKVVS